MRDLLRCLGVYLPIGNTIRVVTVLFTLVQEIKPWPTDEISELQNVRPHHPDIQKNNDPINLSNNAQNKNIIQHPRRNANTPRSEQQTETDTSQIHQARSQITHGSTMWLHGMFKAYTSDN